MRPFHIVLLLFLGAIVSGWLYLATNSPVSIKGMLSNGKAPSPQEKIRTKLETKLKGLKAYLEAKSLQTSYCILADLDAPSGLERLFLYDLDADSILYSGLVTHGRCNKTWLSGRKYSNDVGSGCSSPGKYKVGKKYYGRFGLAYKLHGLDSANSNAFKRYVVLHGHECVPASEIYPGELCQSDGCPTVSPGMLKQLEKKLDASSRPVLLWLYP
ncbi:MAG: murein L,D-transpeptidase catalytic domain-containing protein [Chitinophagaceae bacterium]